MLTKEPRVLRDIFIEKIHKKMETDESIFFLSADFGSPALDSLRDEFKNRFINVGIAEQNLINIAAGLALEGFTVYAYAIAPFLTMRAYEQIKMNLSLLSHIREINVNLIGVGVGLSYDVTGPTHHCLEDISIMRVFPNMVIYSPSDYSSLGQFIDYSIKVKKPKYIRLDGKPLSAIYNDISNFNLESGFYELITGNKVCLVATGFMTHKAMRVAEGLKKEGIRVGVIDLFFLNPVNKGLLYDSLKRYKHIITMEEAFVYRGGLDAIVSDVLRDNNSHIGFTRFGFTDKYCFDVGDRDYLHSRNGLGDEDIIKSIRKIQ
ncbi:MAG: transketolase [Deltaproteobacteria bacterium RBG_19FT_COMBO_43_11]|nr:MAG: transketolase [Deltaproteobacteria bacterium RBG_16_44_11]OGP91440.1 MAG: transketolase [Deltaproteobacteria bacterium RBG_19FT_COMBO_43_11]